MSKPTKWHVRPAKTQISLGIHPVWSESSLSAWRKLGSLATHWKHSENSDQTGRMPRLIWVFTGRTVILLVLSWGGSNKHEVTLATFSIAVVTGYFLLFEPQSVKIPSFKVHIKVNRDVCYIKSLRYDWHHIVVFTCSRFAQIIWFLPYTITILSCLHWHILAKKRNAACELS